MAVDVARENVLDRLAERYEHFAEREQEARNVGKTAISEGAHRYALWILRAYEAESRDEPQHPHTLPIPGCPLCVQP